ncbi:glycoside hydrolase family 172 protein [Enterococcus faecium]|uniref:glycoside hydrolase family 172 protein n=1 Tax=Enterococcus faecium TaxID=1352 RepID=UPI0029C39108|nr:DUF2961 domain-containing protein [Enterococcus faecium]HEI9960625.1 DUF2961 domain-containing protein [Enterococcus faecium]
MSSRSLKELIDRLVDMRRLANKPKAEEKAGTFSSYDRRSYYDDQKMRYVDWAANDDNAGFIRKEGTENVAVELEGPGVIWRVWSAKPQQGKMNVYFDGEEEASYTRPFKQFFEQPTENVSPAGFPSLMPKLSGGYTSFLPIPFEKSIKITFSEDWGEYYHFTYSLYPDEILPSFQEVISKEGLIQLAEMDRALYSRGDRYEKEAISESFVLDKETHCVLDKKESGALVYMGVQLEHESYPTDVLKKILREVLLTIYWDEEEVPAVCVPLGDFFGSSPGYNLFKTLPVGMTEKRLYSNWFMPYSKGVKVELINEGTENIPLIFTYKIEELEKDQAEDYLRFHAKWHNGDFQQLNQHEFTEDGQRWPDWPLLLTEGTGRFCGVHMHILDTWASPKEESQQWWYGQDNQKTIDWWWGEGDEKFFVDGEKFPSTFGTGSEDYIGYAWAAEPPFALFDSPYAAQSLMPVDGNGHTSVLRVQICDNVPFFTSFEGFIEKYKADTWGESNQCIYEVTPFWYQEKGRNDRYQRMPKEIYTKNIE